MPLESNLDETPVSEFCEARTNHGQSISNGSTYPGGYGAALRPLSACALAVLAPWPAAGPTLAFLELLLRSANAAFPGHLLLGIFDPADELVAGQRRDVLPGIECCGVCDQRLAQVRWKLVHHPTGNARTAHRATVACQGIPIIFWAARVPYALRAKGFSVWTEEVEEGRHED